MRRNCFRIRAELHTGWKPRGDWPSTIPLLRTYLRYFHIPGPKTIYRDVYSLEPAHYLVVDRGGIRKFKYWDLSGETVELGKEQDYEDRLHEMLLKVPCVVIW